MNYKVMQRPMFKLGGKAASQGTGITSGLDERVNYSNGGDYKDYLNRAISQLESRDKYYSDLADLSNIKALAGVSELIGTSGETSPINLGLDVLRKLPAVTIPAMMEKKKLEAKRFDPATNLAIAKILKPESGAAMKVYQMKQNDLKKVNQQLYDIGQKLKDNPEDPALLREKALLQETKNLIFSTYSTDDELREKIIFSILTSTGVEPTESEINRIQKIVRGNAEGGTPIRVERRLGSPMMGEQPMMNVEQQDVAMETKGQTNDVYAMLRARLPQEIPDEVVRLLAYNKQAFADFASIKNQEDVTSFNEKYNVSMNIDVSTV